MKTTLASVVALAVLATGGMCQGYKLTRNLTYVERNGKPLKLDFYKPKGAERAPVVLVIHGGGWRKGGRRMPDVAAFVRMFTDIGIACAALTYRLVPEAVHPSQLRDCQRAVQYLRSNAERLGIDPGRIAAAGASAGGHLAALLGTIDDAAKPEAEDPVARMSSRVGCVVAYFGPMNLVPDPKVSRRGIQLVKEFLGGGSEKNPKDVARALQASPCHHITHDDPPMLFVHGDKDHLVPLDQSEKMAYRYRQEGICHDLIVVRGGGHGDFLAKALMRRRGPRPEFWVRTQQFLQARFAQRPAPCPVHGSTPAHPEAAANDR